MLDAQWWWVFTGGALPLVQLSFVNQKDIMSSTDRHLGVSKEQLTAPTEPFGCSTLSQLNTV